jgi:hypothetical protein
MEQEYADRNHGPAAKVPWSVELTGLSTRCLATWGSSNRSVFKPYVFMAQNIVKGATGQRVPSPANIEVLRICYEVTSKRCLRYESEHFPKIQQQPQNAGRQKRDVKQVLYRRRRILERPVNFTLSSAVCSKHVNWYSCSVHSAQQKIRRPEIVSST